MFENGKVNRKLKDHRSPTLLSSSQPNISLVFYLSLKFPFLFNFQAAKTWSLKEQKKPDNKYKIQRLIKFANSKDSCYDFSISFIPNSLLSETCRGFCRVSNQFKGKMFLSNRHKAFTIHLLGNHSRSSARVQTFARLMHRLQAVVRPLADKNQLKSQI